MTSLKISEKFNFKATLADKISENTSLKGPVETGIKVIKQYLLDTICDCFF